MEEKRDYYYTIDFGVNYACFKYCGGLDLLKSIITNSYNKGVDKLVCISNHINESKLNINYGIEIEQLYYTIGCHPHNATSFRDEDLTFLENNINNPKLFAIGECGLDYNRNFSPQNIQRDVFIKQVRLAKKYNKKLYLHCRDAYEDFINILHQENYYNGLVHCFTGNIEQALELTNLGLKLGITGWLLDKRRNHDLVEVIRDTRITLDMLVVETDAPFMPIHPKKKSYPEDTSIIVEEIAKLKKIDTISCGNTIYNNSLRFISS
jgi:TatD DNase family protein